MSTKPRGNLTSLASENFCRKARKMHATTFAMRARKRGNAIQTAFKGYLYQASGDLANTCLPSRLISWFEPRLPLFPLQLYSFDALLRRVLEYLL